MDLDVCDIDERKLLGAVLHTGHQGPGRIDGCKDRHTGLDGVSADDKAVVAALGSLGRDVDDQVDLMSQDQVQDIGRLLLDLRTGMVTTPFWYRYRAVPLVQKIR